MYEQKVNVEKSLKTEHEEDKKSKDGMHIYGLNSLQYCLAVCTVREMKVTSKVCDDDKHLLLFCVQDIIVTESLASEIIFK